MMRTALLALALVSLSFADGGPPDWVPISLLAVLAGLGVLVIFYLISYLVEAEQMRAMATSEMWQVFVTGVMIAGFVGAQALSTEVFAQAFGGAFGAEAGVTHIDYAEEVAASMADAQWNQLSEFMNGIVIPMGNLASIGGTCTFFGAAFSYAGCASINIPFSSASFAARVMSTALMAVNSQLVLLRLASSFFFPVLMPFGLFLRTFHVTRGVGGFLIAFGVAFYFVYPISILVTKGMFDKVSKPVPGSPGIDAVSVDETFNYEQLYTFDVPADSCDPFALDYGYTETQIQNLMDRERMDALLYLFFIGGLFTTALNLLVALSVVRALSRVFGAEVDVSALARIG